jgi:hypothetical protein
MALADIPHFCTMISRKDLQKAFPFGSEGKGDRFCGG